MTKMKEEQLCFRQVHLDFHTGGDIPGVGGEFHPEEFQRTLLDAAVDSITCFAVCHHGFCYYPSAVGPVHPMLKFNLLRAQLDAAHAVGIKAPVYISVGGNEEAFRRHPEWREVPPEGQQAWGGAGNPPLFHKLCFNTAYLDFLCEQTEEVIRNFPDADGLFFDIVFQGECRCPSCQASMRALGLNPEEHQDRLAFGEIVMQKYYDKLMATVRELAPNMPAFHNSCHVKPAASRFFPYYTHWELESLPTGGWGYDHFPLTAAFARKTGFAFTGMTGKFHHTWGEFGGLKTPQALRYECSLMLAAGAKCSIGDQCHPCGRLDESTYRVIGQAYREVRAKEPFCRTAVNRAEIAVLASNLGTPSAIGISRVLQEGHFLFDVLRADMDYSGYPMVILSEEDRLTEKEKADLQMYLSCGGKVMVAGEALRQLSLDFGAEIGEKSELYPMYMLPKAEYRPEYLSSPVVCYAESIKLKVTSGESLGDIYEPYFNRTPQHFCGHCYTPNRLEASGLALGVRKGNLCALSMTLFASYAEHGQVILKDFLVSVIAEMLGEKRIVVTNLPSMARCYVTEDERNSRQVVHLLYANLLKRGDGLEVVDELLPLCDISVSLQVRTRKARKVFLEPQHQEIPFTPADGHLSFKVDKFICHQMVAVEFG
ncbi:MAG: hypothetical protein MJ202_07750 [Lentisphaeria bacterium]|nr:hypothetical protein [Lentisphaeria bacterium]